MARIDAVLNLSSLNGSNGFRIDGASNGDQSGYSVSAAGDVNGDGFADFIIGAPAARPNDVRGAGASYVVFGRSGGFGSRLALSSLDGSNGFRLEGAPYDRSGYSVSDAGDVNGDGFADIVVGAAAARLNGQFGVGAAYVVFGRSGGFGSSLGLSTLDGSNGFRIDGVTTYDNFGRSVSSAGDVNGDGFADIVVTAPGADPNGASYVGSAYVVFGRSGGFGSSLGLSTLDGSNGFRIDGGSTTAIGRSVSSAGDINGDGFDDIIVGGPYGNRNGRYSVGSSYVVFGRSGGFGSSLDVSALAGSDGFRIDGVSDYDLSGFSVSSAGDVNGDGFADLLVGAVFADAKGRSDAGAAYVVFGRSGGFGSALALSSLNGSNGFRIDGESFRAYSGWSVSSAGDVNGDGFADVLVGAVGAGPNGNALAGSTYLVYGRLGGFGSAFDLSSLNGRNGFRIDGFSAGDQSGRSVSAAGDVNGDGFADILVGAPAGRVAGAPSAGTSWVIYGGPSRVAAGDFNHDLTSDVLLQNGGSVVDWVLGEGRYQSGNSITTAATGYSVVGRGDVNRDGTADIVLQNGNTVVDWIMDNGRYRAGNVVGGGAAGYTVRAVADLTGDGTADLVLQNGGTVVEWTLANGTYQSGRVVGTGVDGYTVVGAGDFDGDGDADLLLQNGNTVVEWLIQGGGYQSGRVLTSAAAGFQVVGTGDFNGDGTDDVLLQNSGTIVDWIMRDGQYQDTRIIATGATGFAVRATGDYNGDGTDDLILQAGTGTVQQWSLRDGRYYSSATLGDGAGFTVV